MSSLSLTLIPISDAIVIDGLRSVSKVLPELRNPAALIWSVLDGEHTNTAIESIDNDSNLSGILKQQSFLLRSCNLQFNIINPQNQGGNINLQRTAEGWVNLTSNFPQHWDANPAIKTSLATALHSAFGSYSRSRSLDNFQ